jgi:hypothetical protein
MMNAIPLRFADVRLGQSVEFDGPINPDASMSERVCEMVRKWSGASAASLVSIQTPDDGFAPEHVAGRVMARHLDGSNRADVEVVMRARDTLGKAVVRVALG